MKDEFIKFSKGLGMLTLVLLLISIAIRYFVPAIPITPSFFAVLIFLFLFNLFIFKLLTGALNKKTGQFVNLFMLVNFGKLFLYLIVIFLYSYVNRGDAISFILTFFIYYFVFTFYEVFALLRLVKK